MLDFLLLCLYWAWELVDADGCLEKRSLYGIIVYIRDEAKGSGFVPDLCLKTEESVTWMMRFYTIVPICIL